MTHKAVLTERDKQRRSSDFRAFMKKQGIDGAFVCGEGAVKYLAGEYISAWGALALIPLEGEAVMFFSSPGREYVLTPIHKNLRDYWIQDFRLNCPRNIHDAVAEKGLSGKRLGATIGSMSCGLAKTIADCGAEIMDITMPFAKLRQIKKDNYILLIREAIEIVDRCLALMERELRIGMTEHEVCALIQHEMLRNGAEGSLILINSDKSDISAPAIPFDHTPKKLEAGDHMVAEVTVNYRGCWLQRIAILSFGPADADIRLLHDTVNDAIIKNIKMAGPGKNAGELISAIDDYIEAKGFLSPRTGYVSGPQGHLSGFEMDEGGFEPGINFILEPGMLFVLHPGAALPGWREGEKGIFGPGMMFCITEDGCETLSKIPNRLIEIYK